MNKLDPEHLYETPLTVRTMGRAVVLLGPDAVAISMTPEAAIVSAELLLTAADAARRSNDPSPELPIQQE